MLDLRRLITLLALLLPLTIAGCRDSASEWVVPDPAKVIAGGRRDAAQWIAAGRSPSPLPVEVVIPLGYLERLRLGLGSPFRLAEFALHDPRLEEGVRRRTAAAILARTLDRQGYQVDPAILDLAGLSGARWVDGAGSYHLRLIDDAISAASDPRMGELAVRLAYSLAAAEGAVSGEAPLLIAQVAALIRDRELAEADLQNLIRAAEEGGADPIELISIWRSDRRFLVERPALEPLGAEAEREAIEYGLRLARTLRTLGPKLVSARHLVRAKAPGTGSLLSYGAAKTLAMVAAELDAPPRTPVILAVDAQRGEIWGSWLDDEERAAWSRFLDGSRGEEELAAEYAILLDQVDDAASTAGEAVLGAAVGLRTYAQERVWYPGYGGPTTRELTDRFGIIRVGFDNDVRPAWRPFYRGIIAESLRELQRVLPSLNLRGLSFHIGTGRGGEQTLALHDPMSRTIFLSPDKGMGTIAHEIAHDLDWQVALRRYRVRGDYASDRAVREEGDRLATSIERLTTATLQPPLPGDPSPVIHAQRPAEVFARSVDWFVLASLAREARSNGYLTSAQDAMLTGYGTVRPPEVWGGAARALIEILDEVAPVYPTTRDWFLQSYGPNRAVGPYDLVRRIVETEVDYGLALKGADPDSTGLSSLTSGGPGLPPEVMISLSSLEAAHETALAAIDAIACLAPAITGADTRLSIARRGLVRQAAEARARGIALSYATRVAGDDGRGWLARRLYGTPWSEVSVDPVVAGFLEIIATEVGRLREVRAEVWPGIMPWTASSDRCTAAVLLASVRHPAHSHPR